jgi:hypothetical protein
MALVTALKFIERLEREDTLRHQLYVSVPQDIYKLTEFAHAKGFVISPNDLADAIEQYQEKFATGSIQPLKAYVKGFKRLPSGEEKGITPMLDEAGTVKDSAK